MRVSVLIPVGPGHEKHVQDALASVTDAATPIGWTIDSFTMDDTDGELGRSKSRNLLAEAAISQGADWLMWLDADDLVDPDCFMWARLALHDDPDLDAIWGRIVRQRAWKGSDGRIQKLEVIRSDSCKAPLRHVEELLELPGHTTLRVGNFTHVDLFERVGGWLERIDVGEDHEFHYACAMHARKFVKLDETLVWIRTYLDGAHGPRGYLAGDPRIYAHRNLGETIAQYWRDRDAEQWTDYEKGLRLDGLFYDWEYETRGSTDE